MNASAPASRSRIPVPEEHVEVELVDNDVLLYHPLQTTAVHLNPTAAMVFGLCDGARTVGDIISVLEESYPDAPSPIGEGVEAALDGLHRDGMIVYR